MLIYPYSVERDSNESLLVSFPDIPEANAVGDDETEAAINAAEALEAALEIYFDERRPIPMPSKKQRGQFEVRLPALITSKVLLSNEMVNQGVRKSELARRMEVHMPQVDRLLDPRHSSKIEQVESALSKLGRHLDVSIA